MTWCDGLLRLLAKEILEADHCELTRLFLPSIPHTNDALQTMKMTRSLPRLVLLSLALVAAVTLLAPEWSTEGDSSSLSLLPSARVVSAVGKKLTEKQLQDIEDQWMEDEEEDEGERRAGGRRRTRSDA